MNDQAILRRGLRILEGMIKALEDGDRIDISDVTTILKVFESFERSDEHPLIAEVESALRSRKGVDFVRTSRQLAATLSDHLEKDDVEQEGAAAAVRAMNDALAEKFVNLSRLEYKYVARTPGARKMRSASASYGT